jgi:hypothetical protein
MSEVVIRKHFVSFLSPGVLVHEETTKPIESWDPVVAKEMAHEISERHGVKPFGFRFFTRERGAEELDSRVTKRSGMYFLGGKIETLEEVEARNADDEKILRSNMRCNGIKRIITNTNSWKIVQPLEDDDVVLQW